MRTWWLCPECGCYNCDLSVSCRCGLAQPVGAELLDEYPADADCVGYVMTEEELAEANERQMVQEAQREDVRQRRRDGLTDFPEEATSG